MMELLIRHEFTGDWYIVHHLIIIENMIMVLATENNDEV